MNKFIAFLRGINVGGHRRIKMAELKKMFEDLGFAKVQTYIQSGNVIFQTIDSCDKTLSEKIESAISEQFGFTVPVIIRTCKEMKKILSQNPFPNIKDFKQLNVTLLSDKPKPEERKEMDKLDFGADKFVIKGKEVYISYEGKCYLSKLTNNLLEKKLKVSATSRNWKTINKMNEMCCE